MRFRINISRLFKKENQKNELINAIHNSQIVIRYATRNAVTLSEKVLQPLIFAYHKTLIEEQHLSEKEQLEFWLAYNKAHDHIRPFTSESIVINKHKFLGFIRMLNLIYLSITLLGLVLFYFLVKSQSLLLMGKDLINKTDQNNVTLKELILERDQLLEQRDLYLENNRQHEFSELIRTKSGVINDQIAKCTSNTYEMSQWYKKLDNFMSIQWSIGGLSIVNYNIMDSVLSNNEKRYLSEAYIGEQDIESKLDSPQIYYKLESSSRTPLKILEIYLIPVILGLLGAYLFTTMKTIRALQDTTFKYSDISNGLAQLIVGAFSGVLISGFLMNDSYRLSNEINITAYFAAFGAGYSTEAFLAFINSKILPIMNGIGSSKNANHRNPNEDRRNSNKQDANNQQ